MKKWIQNILRFFSWMTWNDIPTQIAKLHEKRFDSERKRDSVYEDIQYLEEKEQELLAEGKASQSVYKRKCLAAQISQLRKEIGRQHVLSRVYADRVNIAAIDIHNLMLLQEGVSADLPSAETLTEHAVAAEEMLENLSESADLSSTLERENSILLTDEEKSIFAEFDQPLELADTEIEKSELISVFGEKTPKIAIAELA